MTTLLSNVFGLNGLGKLLSLPKTCKFQALPTSLSTILNNSNNHSIKPTSLWSLDTIRTVVRNNFPRPSERKRVKKLGWKARLSTRGGRRVIMQRILKGRFYITH